MRRQAAMWAWAALLVPVLALAQGYGLEDEPLPPDQAFKFAAEAESAETIVGTWTVAEGYYLYHDKITFSSNTTGITLGEPQIPPGKKKEDEFFGLVETHRNQVAIKIPVQRSADAPDSVELVAKSQGCADIGICYPPYETTLKVALPAVAAGQSSGSGGAALSSVRELGRELGLGDASQEFLHPDEAFALSTGAGAGALEARWAIAEGYYLYKDKIEFRLKDAPAGISLGEPQLPAGKIKDDEFFGRMEAYVEDFGARVPVRGAQPGQRVAVDVTYQGCADAGLCYPPQTKTVEIVLASAPAATGSGAASTGAPASAPSSPAAPTLDTRTVVLTLLGAFGVGLLLTFTPCVLPMIPILSSIIVGQSGERTSATRGGTLSIIYVLGTAVTWTAAGVMAGAFGDQLQAYFQNPWAIGVFVVILVALALSMFGFYEIQMPSSIQSKLQERSQNVRSGTAAGVFVMGILSAAIVGACVSPLLISVLGVAIAFGDPVLGGATTFMMALGMGVFLIALGFGLGGLLPKAGGWMDTVKHGFGVLLLGVAVYLLGVLPQVPVLYLWATLLIITGVYMGATQGVPREASGWQYLWKGMGTLALVWGVLALLGAFAGNRDILRPIEFGSGMMVASAGAGTGAAARSAATDPHDLFRHVDTVADVDRAMAEARDAGKPVLVDFYADWCTDCLRMERGTFSNPQVQQFMQQNFVALQVDVTDNNDVDRAVKKHLGVFGPPALLFYSASGDAMEDLHFYGYKPADEFLTVLQQAVR